MTESNSNKNMSSLSREITHNTDLNYLRSHIEGRMKIVEQYYREGGRRAKGFCLRHNINPHTFAGYKSKFDAEVKSNKRQRVQAIPHQQIHRNAEGQMDDSISIDSSSHQSLSKDNYEALCEQIDSCMDILNDSVSSWELWLTTPQYSNLAHKLIHNVDWSWVSKTQLAALSLYQIFLLCKIVAEDFQVNIKTGHLQLSPTPTIDDIWRSHVLRSSDYLNAHEVIFGDEIENKIIDYSIDQCIWKLEKEEIEDGLRGLRHYLFFLCPDLFAKTLGIDTNPRKRQRFEEEMVHVNKEVINNEINGDIDHCGSDSSGDEKEEKEHTPVANRDGDKHCLTEINSVENKDNYDPFVSTESVEAKKDTADEVLDVNGKLSHEIKAESDNSTKATFQEIFIPSQQPNLKQSDIIRESTATDEIAKQPPKAITEITGPKPTQIILLPSQIRSNMNSNLMSSAPPAGKTVIQATNKTQSVISKTPAKLGGSSGQVVTATPSPHFIAQPKKITLFLHTDTQEDALQMKVKETAPMQKVINVYAEHAKVPTNRIILRDMKGNVINEKATALMLGLKDHDSLSASITQ